MQRPRAAHWSAEEDSTARSGQVPVSLADPAAGRGAESASPAPIPAAAAAFDPAAVTHA
jgi:hypothetical protein